MNEQDQDQVSLFSRIGRWFRGSSRPNGDLPLEQSTTEIQQVDGAQSTFLRPWAKRDAAISNLQESFTVLTDLIGTIKENLERQNQRQDELIGYLSHLPEALASIPEGQKMQSETLRTLAQQIQQQSAQQSQVADVLEKVGDAHVAQKDILENLRQRVDAVAEHDETMAEHLKFVGAAMQTVSHNSESSAQVLRQMRDNANTRDGEMERILHRQNTRFTTMLAVSIFIAIAALAAVAVMGYLVVTRMPGK